MAEPDIKHDLTPEEERLAESYFCRKWGEPPATEDVTATATARPGLHEELEAADEALRTAYASVPANDALVKNVMKALPAKPGLSITRDTAKTETDMYVRVEGPERLGLSWVWGAAGAVAALVFIAACLWLPSLRKGLDAPSAQVTKGRVVDGSGQEVTALSSGQTYRVEGAEAVVRVGKDAAVRFLEASRFAVPVSHSNGLRLDSGWAYAQSPERNALRMESQELAADIQGVSLVFQQSVGPGEGMVLVFKGKAFVRPVLGDEELTLKEGQVFTVALGSFAIESFMETAKETARELEQVTGDPVQLRNLRKQYAQAVASYRRELLAFNEERSVTKDSKRKAELERRCVLVKQYLKQHQRRLRSLPRLGENETPKQRAERVRRAAERIERGRKDYIDPSQWL